MLNIEGLTKAYTPGVEVLKGINLKVATREFVAIIGPSGAGKSTLLRSINMLVPPTKGKVYFEGCLVNSLKGNGLRKLRSNIGMIFQNYNLIGRSNVIENVMHGRLGHVSFVKSAFGLYSQSELEDAYSLLRSVGLEDYVHRKASELSGGQMQRVGICRAMMQNPKLLLADEPIASLDPASAELVMEQIKELTTKHSLTNIISLHQVDIAKKYATRIVGLRQGKIVFDGPPEKLTDKLVEAIYGKIA